MASASPSSAALRRLARDMRELSDPTCVDPCLRKVVFDPENLYVCHATIVPACGPYVGVPFHLKLDFNNSYPQKAPMVSVEPFPTGHPNVWDWGICLDMLRDSEEPWQGWSSAYTLSAVLMQLVGFLFTDDTIDQDHGGRRVQRANRHMPDGTLERLLQEGVQLQSTCRLCSGCQQGGGGGDDGRVWVAGAAEAAAGGGGAAAVGRGASLRSLPAGVLYQIFSHVAPEGLHRCIQASPLLAPYARHELQARELTCFHSKKPSTETVLGFGLTLEHHAGGRGGYGSTPAIKRISSQLEYLSREAYEEGVRLSVWNVSFDNFLPLFINADHGSRARPVLDSCVASIMQLPRGEPVRGDDILMVCSLLLHSTAMSMISRQENGQVTRGMCDAALSAFCHLHHLLVGLAVTRPELRLVERCTLDVKRFLSKAPGVRSKAQCPDIGLLLVKYMLVPADEVTWAQFGPVLLRETLARNVHWNAQALYGEEKERYLRMLIPRNQSPEDDNRWLLATHMKGAAVGLRLLMFQAWFANVMGRSSPLPKVMAAYNKSLGRPPPALFDAFNEHVRSVLRCDKWMPFLDKMRLSLHYPSRLDKYRAMAAVLRQAIVDSAASNYTRHPSTRDVALMMLVDWEQEPVRATTIQSWRRAT